MKTIKNWINKTLFSAFKKDTVLARLEDELTHDKFTALYFANKFAMGITYYNQECLLEAKRRVEVTQKAIDKIKKL
jgi:hypothetical protein